MWGSNRIIYNFSIPTHKWKKISLTSPCTQWLKIQAIKPKKSSTQCGVKTMHKLKKLLENGFLCFKEILRTHWTYFFERKKNQSHSAETMELNIILATLLDQQKSHEPTAHRTFSQEGEIQSVMPLFYLLALKEIKRSFAVKLMQTKLFFFFFLHANHVLLPLS